MSRYYESCSTYSVTDQNTDRGNHLHNNAHSWTPINHLFITNRSHKIYLMIIYLARDCITDKQRYSLAVWSWILWAWLTKMLLSLAACYSSWLIRPTLWNSDFLWTSSDVHANSWLPRTHYINQKDSSLHIQYDNLTRSTKHCSQMSALGSRQHEARAGSGALDNHNARDRTIKMTCF